jgi:glycosyltransferase involved in cell wall biosynthesis
LESKGLKIGIVSLSSGQLGDSVRITQFSNVLKQMGYEVKILNPYTELLPFLAGRNSNRTRLTTLMPEVWRNVSKVPGVKCCAMERLAYGSLSFIMSRALYRMAKRENLDLLQAETFLAADVALPVKDSLGLPMIFDIHSGFFTEEIKKTINPTPGFLHYWRNKEKQILNSSDHVIVTTHAMKELLESNFGIRNISLAPNGAIPWNGDRAVYHVPLRVIYAGIFAYWERVQDYLDAAKLVGNSNFEFFLIGEGYQKSELLAKIDAENIPVKYLGYLPKEDFKKQMSTMHIGVAPWEKEIGSKFYSSTKTYEYLSMGMPVICADAGEWATMVQENDCGLLVPPEDPESIAKAILAYQNREMWERHSANGLNLIKKQYSWEKIISNLYPIYENMKAKG